MPQHESLTGSGFEIQGGSPGFGGDAKPSRTLPSALSVPGHDRAPSARDFYQRYQWTTNPLLSLEECLVRMSGELELLKQPLADWQRREIQRNLFLLTGAVDQIACDFLARGHYDFSKLAKSFSWLNVPVRFLHATNRLLVALRESLFDRQVAGWQVRWRELALQAACLILRDDCPAEDWGEFAERFRFLSHEPLPAALKERRLKLPSAFCSMDLTHYDYFALASKFADGFADRHDAILILGLRSAGNYLAPLVEGRLRAYGFQNLKSLTIRPKVNGLSARESSALRHAAREDRRVLVVDDLPTSGKTLRVACELLERHGTARSRIVLLVPQQPEYELREKLEQKNYPADVARIELKVEEWWKLRWLRSAATQHVVEELAAQMGRPSQVVSTGPEIEACERELDFQRRYGLRAKKLYVLRPTATDDADSEYAILAKSMGWGWFGYRGWLVSEKLDGQLPRTLALREGVLFMEWSARTLAADGDGVRRESLLYSLAGYLGRRARELPLPQDLPAELIDRGNTSWDYLAESLAGANGRAVAKLALPAVRRRLIQDFRNAPTTLIDAKLTLDKWAIRDENLVKLDFEGHGIDNADLYMMDPAFDLAAAVFEFSLSPVEEEALLTRYIQATGDSGISERMPALKQLYGLRELRKTGERLAAPPQVFDRHEGHARFQSTRRFLVDSLLRHYGKFLPAPQRGGDPRALFVLDIDGVLDEYMYEYPATTLSGLEALAILHRHNLPIVLNTERSLEDVQAYSKFFYLEGGVAEHGTVLWDARNAREKVLVDEETLEQMARVRVCLSTNESVFFSAGYCASLHCYSYGGGATRRGLDAQYVQSLLQKEGLDRLRAVCRKGETTIVARSLDKGTGLLALQEFLGLPRNLAVHAIGNAEEDLPMLRAAGRAYAVANSTQGLKSAARSSGFTMLKRCSQRGLFEAARLAVQEVTNCSPGKTSLISPSVVARDPLLRAARIADQSKLRRSMALFHRDLLGLFQV